MWGGFVPWPGDPCLSFPIASPLWTRGLVAPRSHEQTWGGPISDVPNPSVCSGDPSSATAVLQESVTPERFVGTGMVALGCVPSMCGDPKAQLRVLRAPPGQGGLILLLSIHGGKGRGMTWKDNRDPRVTQRDSGHPGDPRAQLSRDLHTQGGRDPSQGRL